MGPVVRRPVAWVVAVVLFVEALGIGALNWFLGIVVDRQDMSLAGLDPDVMSMSSKVGGVVFGAYFALCGLVALLVALRDRAPAGLGRVLLISAAVVHALLGAFTWGLVGWTAFLFMVVVFALIVLVLMTYDGRSAPERPADAAPAGDGDGSPVTPPPAPTTP
ncbi:FtsH-binding integral membrane protein [Streptomyces tendae]